MNGSDFTQLAGCDDALYRTLGLLIRQLHVKGFIDAQDLTREIRLLAEQLDQENSLSQQSAAGMAAIAASIDDSLPAWTEARTVAQLYCSEPDKGRASR